MKEKTQLLGLKQIKVDHGIQSRVAMNMEVAREFSQAMVRGDEFPPIDVFFDGDAYLLADGFHRYEAARHVGKTTIRCQVHPGDRRDALIFSAGANKQFSVKRTPDDIRKAICMLLEDEEWFNRNDSQVAHHVGCSGQTVWRVRSEFCREAKVDPPAEFEDSLGRIRPARRHFSVARRVAETRNEPAIPDRYSLEYSYVRDFFRQFGFRSVVEQGQGQTYPGIRVIHHQDAKILATPCDFVLHDSLPLSAGRLLLANQVISKVNRLIIICYRDDGPKQVIAHAEDLGISFVSPEALIAEMKAKAAKPKLAAI
jgi:hypothetical protein